MDINIIKKRPFLAFKQKTAVLFWAAGSYAIAFLIRAHRFPMSHQNVTNFFLPLTKCCLYTIMLIALSVKHTLNKMRHR